jgi:hypothetical protein
MMTAEEEKDVHQTATRHFEEDRNELREAPRVITTFSRKDASQHREEMK